MMSLCLTKYVIAVIKLLQYVRQWDELYGHYQFFMLRSNEGGAIFISVFHKRELRCEEDK